MSCASLLTTCLYGTDLKPPPPSGGRYDRYRSKPDSRPSALSDLKASSWSAPAVGSLGPLHTATPSASARAAHTNRLPATARLAPNASTLTQRLMCAQAESATRE